MKNVKIVAMFLIMLMVASTAVAENLDTSNLQGNPTENEYIVVFDPNLYSMDYDDGYDYLPTEDVFSELPTALEMDNSHVVVISDLVDNDETWKALSKSLSGKLYTNKVILFMAPEEPEEEILTRYQEIMASVLDKSSCSLGFAFAGGDEMYVAFDHYRL